MTKQQLTNYSNKQAIREILGCFLQQPSLIKDYKVTKNDFPETFHKLIFAAINNLYKNGAETIDSVAIDEYLSNYETQYQIFLKNEGIDFIDKVEEMAAITNIKYYYEQLKKFTLLRSYVEEGQNVSDFFDPNEIDPITIENQREKLDNYTIMDIIKHYKEKQLKVSAPFILGENRDSKKAGVGGKEQKEKWKKDTAWGIGYSSAYLTTILHGLRKRRFTVNTMGTGIGKSRGAIGNIGYACAPAFYDKKTDSWIKNPNGTNNGALYIGTEMELLEEIDPILWAYIADVPQDHIEYNAYEEGEEERVDIAIEMLEKEANIWFEYLPDYDSGMLEEVIEEHKIKHNISHVFFDYIHTTIELISEYSTKSKTKMVTREDQVLAELSSKLKSICRKYDISLDTSTQVTGDFKNEANRDQTIVRGAKSIIDKADSAYIAMPPSEKELKKIEPILRSTFNQIVPNLVYNVYKNRGGKFNKVKIWLYIDYGTMRTYDLFVTDYDYKINTDKVKGLYKTYINIEEEDITSKEPIYKPIEKIISERFEIEEELVV